MFKLLKKAKPYTKQLIFVVILLFGSSLLDLVNPTLMRSIINVGIKNGDFGFIIRTGLLMLVVSLGSAACSAVTTFISARVSESLTRDIRNEVFEKITYYSITEVNKIGTASLITRTINDVRQVAMVLRMGLRQIVSVPLHLIGGAIMAAGIDLKLSIIVVLALPVLCVVIFLNIMWVRPLFKIMQVKLDKVNSVIRENLSGVRVIRAFDRIVHEHQRFNNTNMELVSTDLTARRRMALLNPITMFVMHGVTVCIYWFGQFRINVGHMTTGDVMTFAQYAMQILTSVMGMQMIFNMIPRAMVSATRVNEVLDMESEIVAADNPITPDESQHGKVKFDHVTFTYPGAEEPVLRDISFEANPGETVAIIGGTGSGKSTLVSLIPRLYDIQEGEVTLDGINVKQMDEKNLRDRIGFVAQKALLFTGSVSDNLRYGNDDATDEELLDATDIAQATNFINNMEDGFEAYISQDATNISGGQKQRLSIARAIVRRPEVYIFDDSFSALDFKTDAALRAALVPITRESTVIIVAQRVSTVMNADRIIVLDQGQCVGIGTHQELMANCPVYDEIVRSQLKEEEIA